MHRFVGAFVDHDGLIHADVEHEFAPHSTKNVVFYCVRHIDPVKQIHHSLQILLLYVVFVLDAQTDFPKVRVGHTVVFLDRIHALNDAMKDRVHSVCFADDFFTGDSVEQ
ncbi:hypothetical protein SDC9_210278 [bioreactor metagenome]|uniref:Uncharacterized protein n=1 Tax=bioreactor metagenome TaxID=1076179 RepID=A0A645JIK7_9ZZZZ